MLEMLFMANRKFSELSKADLIPLYCAILRPYLKYTMDANYPHLIADSGYLKRRQRLATQLMKGLSHVPYKKRLLSPTSSHLNAGIFDLTNTRN